MTSSSKLKKEIEIKLGELTLKAILTVPDKAIGLVLFAHGSGSGRLSPRNNFVAGILNDSGIATLLADLLTVQEEKDRRNVFDIDLLAERLVAITNWAWQEKNLKDLSIGYFGASTGAAAAIEAEVLVGNIDAIVSRGGRPDLAKNLSKVKAPTLLLVGGEDFDVILLNQEAFNKLKCQKKIEIIPGAGHLFEEPGTLEEVAELARQWFLKNLIVN